MSSLYDFVKRHRRKFVVGGAIVGGATLAFTLLDRHISQVREDERKKQLEIVRKRNHYESTDCAVTSTFIQLFHQLKNKIDEIHDTDHLKEALREGPDKEEKLRLWNEMKNVCFSKAVCYIIAEAFLGVLLRVQLNILAGYLYSDTTSTSNNNSETRYSAKFQQVFLNISTYFVDEGFKEFSEIALLNVKSCVAFIQLQDEIGLDNVENIFTQIQDRILSDYPERNLALNPGRFLLSSTQSLPSDFTDKEVEQFKEAISETLEILESQEVLNLMTRTCRRGFAILTDKLSEPFCDVEQSESESGSGDESKSATETSEKFVSPCRVRIPLVKLLPVLASCTQDPEVVGTNDDWLTSLTDSADLKNLGANVYESFSVSVVKQTSNLGDSALQFLQSFKSKFSFM